MELQTKENSIQELKNENVEKEERILTKKMLQSRGGYGGLVWKLQTPSKDCRLWHVVYP
ncbi:MAG: hypothetical protein ACLSFA_03700 [Roseburia inulinivorans]